MENIKLIKQTYRFSYYLLEAENKEFEYADIFVVWNQVPSRIVAILGYDKEHDKVYDIKTLSSGLTLTSSLIDEVKFLFDY